MLLKLLKKKELSAAVRQSQGCCKLKSFFKKMRDMISKNPLPPPTLTSLIYTEHLVRISLEIVCMCAIQKENALVC
jgi:hypothetical protein